MAESGSPALTVAKNGAQAKKEIEVNGVKVRIIPVSAALLEATQRLIPTPVAPTYHDDDSGKDIPNPMHPDYVAALEDAQNKRNAAAMDTMVMFGVELVDGMPEDDGWLKKLLYLQKKLGHDIGLDKFDVDDPMDKEYLYKRFLMANSEILEAVTRASGLTSEEIRAAEDTFPSN